MSEFYKNKSLAAAPWSVGVGVSLGLGGPPGHAVVVP